MKKTIVIFMAGVVLGGLFLNKGMLHKITSVPVATLPDGGKYIGELSNGVLQGVGEIEWPNGTHFKGDFENGEFHGEGHMTFTNGQSYTGEFNRGEISGFGTFTYNDNSHYKGEMLNGLMNGSGTFVEKGGEYIGQLKDNLFHGSGSYHHHNGDVYSGLYQQGRYHGKGVFTYSGGEQFSGDFVDGTFTGMGVHKSVDAGEYQGGFEDWYYHGKGTYSDQWGDKWIGEFDKGALTGQGEYLGKDGAFYRGEFSDWRYHGEGEYHSVEGDVYKGRFKYGKYHGKGVLTYQQPLDGIKTINGVWRRGRLEKDDARPEMLSQKSFHELAMYNQNELLNKAWQGLEENDPNKIDMYLLTVAGDGSQGVFRRESNYIKNYFDNKLGTKGKSMQLINSRVTARDIPQSTTTSIKRSLTTMAGRMDAQQDVLFVYLTSHGSKDHKFYLNHSAMGLNDLSAKELANMLADIPVKWKVLVVSACYSGGFIPELKDENTLVITAAASDRTSFGCSDGAEFTYFGQAFIKEALPTSDSFSAAFDKAFELVSLREKAEDFEASTPQIHKPEAILAQLKRWRAGLPKNVDGVTLVE